jgi:hypothetical protein
VSGSKVLDTAYIEDAYARWGEFSQTKIRLPGERLWARELPDGLVAIDNRPLHPDFRWQDILLPGEYGDKPATKEDILYRRWKTLVFLGYKVPMRGIDMNVVDYNLEQIARRRIYGVLKDIGQLYFLMAGVAGLHLEEELDEDAAAKTAIDLVDEKAGLGIWALED